MQHRKRDFLACFFSTSILKTFLLGKKEEILFVKAGIRMGNDKLFFNRKTACSICVHETLG